MHYSSHFDIGYAFASKNGQYTYITGNDLKLKEGQLLIFDNIQIKINKTVLLTDLVIKGEYARIRDGKEGKLLLEYRKDEKYVTYILYDPLHDKVFSKADKVPWHVGNVYLDDSLDNIVINDAKYVKVNNKTERQYTNKVLIYSFSKQGKVKEIPIKEGSKIETVKDKIYLRQDNKIHVENLK